ncbi:MAG: TAXI family TRAP transporter solute-binding subunit [Pseudomonadota bacterium]
MTFYKYMKLGLLGCFATILAALSHPAIAQSQEGVEANKGRLGILSARSSDTHAAVTADIARVLDGKSGLRIVPYLGPGSVQNIDDVLGFRHADMALINSDAMTYRRLLEPNSDQLNNIFYIAQLFSLEMHLITRTDTGISSISDLNGRRIASGESKSGTFLTASLLLRSAGIRATAIALPIEDSLLELKDGTIDAVFYLGGRPSATLQKISADEGLVLANIPHSSAMASVYGRSELTSEDYPTLVQDKFIETVSVNVVLAMRGSPPAGSNEYTAIRSFVSEFIRNSAQFQRPPSHPKWANFSFETEIDGWERSPIVLDVLAGKEPEVQEQATIEDLMLQVIEENNSNN